MFKKITSHRLFVPIGGAIAVILALTNIFLFNAATPEAWSLLEFKNGRLLVGHVMHQNAFVHITDLYELVPMSPTDTLSSSTMFRLESDLPAGLKIQKTHSDSVAGADELIVNASEIGVIKPLNRSSLIVRQIITLKAQTHE